MQKITPLPKPPTTQDAQNFDLRADVFLEALPLFAKELNSFGEGLNALPQELAKRADILKEETREAIKEERGEALKAIDTSKNDAIKKIDDMGYVIGAMQGERLALELALMRLEHEVSKLTQKALTQKEGMAKIGTYALFLRSELPFGYEPLGKILSAEIYPFAYLWARRISKELTEGLPRGYFRLPKAGMFARGSAEAREVGSYQGDAMRKITGWFGSVDVQNGYGGEGAFRELWRWSVGAKRGGGDRWGVAVGFDNSRVTPVAEENRPQNNRYLEGIYVGIPQILH